MYIEHLAQLYSEHAFQGMLTAFLVGGQPHREATESRELLHLAALVQILTSVQAMCVTLHSDQYLCVHFIISKMGNNSSTYEAIVKIK